MARQNNPQKQRFPSQNFCGGEIEDSAEVKFTITAPFYRQSSMRILLCCFCANNIIVIFFSPTHLRLFSILQFKKNGATAFFVSLGLDLLLLLAVTHFGHAKFPYLSRVLMTSRVSALLTNSQWRISLLAGASVTQSNVF